MPRRRTPAHRLAAAVLTALGTWWSLPLDRAESVPRPQQPPSPPDLRRHAPPGRKLPLRRARARVQLLSQEELPLQVRAHRAEAVVALVTGCPQGGTRPLQVVILRCRGLPSIKMPKISPHAGQLQQVGLVPGGRLGDAPHLVDGELPAGMIQRPTEAGAAGPVR